MPAVASSSTLADAPDTPHHRAVPGNEHTRLHTERVASTLTRRHPGRAVPVHPASSAATDRARGDASPTQPVPGDEREPCSQNLPRRIKDRVSIGRSMPAAPASLPGWGGLPEKVDVLGGAHPCPHP